MQLYAAYKRVISAIKTHRLKVKGWKKLFCAYGNQNKAMLAILTSDKIDVKP